jgi:hypothetical protein
MASYNYTFASGDTVTPTKLNNARTVSEIVNADVKSDAAIAGTKIAPNFGSQNIATTGSLGVGTTATTFKTISAHGTDDGAWLHGSSTSSYIGLGGFSSGASGAFRLNYERTTGAITFNGGSRDTPEERMRINGIGNVSIGNQNPLGRFHIESAADTTLVITDTDTSSFSFGAGGASLLGTDSTGGFVFKTGVTTGSLFSTGTERMRVKTTGQVRFQPLSSDPSGAESGDVYYNSSSNKLKVYNGTSWVDLH